MGKSVERTTCRKEAMGMVTVLAARFLLVEPVSIFWPSETEIMVSALCLCVAARKKLSDTSLEIYLRDSPDADNVRQENLINLLQKQIPVRRCGAGNARPPG